MAKTGPARQSTPSAAFVPEQAPRGSVRPCGLYAGELLRHRIITADGHDVAVVTSPRDGQKPALLTVAYPVQNGYLVMIRQPICTLRANDEAGARETHERLVRVLAEAGVGVVRARRLVGHQANAEELAIVEIDLA